MDSRSRNRAWIFVNGNLPHPEALSVLIQPEDMLIAADGGARHLLRMHRVPHFLIGDLDSLTEAEVETLKNQGTKVWRFPDDKDWTDLELALNFACDSKFDSIRLTAASGGRMDQQLANILLLTRPELAEIDIALDDGTEEVFLIHQEREIHGQPGDRVSLIPLDAQVEGVSTKGLRWKLKDEPLYRSATRGISNIMDADMATITARKGTLLCIHTRKEFIDEETH
ncbi:MAG: thiamine diphosphokinase [Anaerolineae bacterium]|jgi:thiamine pyrophosphokinase|nr:thiamine diphosphokinase [Anaerolineae bacterium]